MQFKLSQLMIVLVLVALGFAAVHLGHFVMSAYITGMFVMIGVVCYINLRHLDICPEVLKLRYYLVVVCIFFCASLVATGIFWWPFAFLFVVMFYAFGFWMPPVNLVFTILAVPLYSVMQVIKLNSPTFPHIGIRVIQLFYLGWLIVMDLCALFFGIALIP